MKINVEMQKQGFFYIIPAMLVEAGNPTKALLYGLITSLVNKDGYCWATNNYLARKIGMRSKTQVSIYLRELKDEGWLVVEVASEKGNTRKIWLGTPLPENRQTPISENRTTSFGKPKDPRSENRKEVISKRVLKKSIYTSHAFKDHFDRIWEEYPLKTGRSKALKKFLATVKTDQDWQNIQTALKNYKTHLSDNTWKQPQDGKTWFNNWQDWINYCADSGAKAKPAAPNTENSKEKVGKYFNGKYDKDTIKKVLGELPEDELESARNELKQLGVYDEDVYNQVIREMDEKVNQCFSDLKRKFGVVSH